MKKIRSANVSVERLEGRVCLSATASLFNGNLLVAGNPASPVEITALDADS